MRTISILTLLLITLSGCTEAINAETIAFQGEGEGLKTKTLECKTDGRMGYLIQGQGTVTVTITDGNGQTLLHEDFNGQGQEGNSQNLIGEKGTWKLQVQYGGAEPYSNKFQGHFSITLHCDKP